MTTTLKNKRLLWQVPFLLLLIVGTIFIIRQQRSMPYQKNHGMIFGTVYNITYQSGSDLQAEIERVLKEVDAEFSMFNDTSTVARLNRNEQPRLSNSFIDVFQLAQRIADDTQGAFDVTVAPLVNAWGFGFKNEQLPTRRQVDSLLNITGYKMLSLDKQHNRLAKQKNGMMLDFSAIAKGYGCDAVARMLQSHDVKNYMVEIGGEVVTSGISPNRLPWRIGVTKPTEDPLTEEGELQTILNVTDCAMATSGNYRNFYYKGGRKYAHTINPLTGYPVQHSLLSATVLAKECAVADAYATAFMVMGIEQAKTVLANHPELMAYFIYTDQKGRLTVWFSESLKSSIQ